jgi:hypothetical protein
LRKSNRIGPSENFLLKNLNKFLLARIHQWCSVFRLQLVRMKQKMKCFLTRIYWLGMMSFNLIQRNPIHSKLLFKNIWKLLNRTCHLNRSSISLLLTKSKKLKNRMESSSSHKASFKYLIKRNKNCLLLLNLNRKQNRLLQLSRKKTLN